MMPSKISLGQGPPEQWASKPMNRNIPIETTLSLLPLNIICKRKYYKNSVIIHIASTVQANKYNISSMNKKYFI